MNATTDWLPGDPPASGAGEYFRLKDLKTYKDRTADLRVLCPFIHGWEVWVKDGKPVRAQERDQLPPSDDWRVENGKRNEPKPFWAAFVWNHVNGKVQVFAFTQGSIYGQIKTLVENKKWGALSDYDLTIKSKGEGLETEYSVTPNPKEPLPEAAVAAWKDVEENAVGLAALYVGGNPLSAFGE